MPRFVVPSLFLPSRRSVTRVELLVIRQDQVRVAADQQPAAVDALLGEPVDLGEQHRGVDHDAVADDRRDVVVQDAARHQLEREASHRPTTIVCPALWPPW